MIGSPLCIGIDPGVRGGMVALWEGRLYSTALEGMNLYQVRDWLEQCAQWGKDSGVYACIEKVGGFIGERTEEGGKKNKASAHTMFTFGQSFGQLEMCLVCARITRRYVLPRVWQLWHNIPPKMKGEKQPKFKRRLQDVANSLHPEGKLNQQVCDAYLIARYCQSQQWE